MSQNCYSPRVSMEGCILKNIRYASFFIFHLAILFFAATCFLFASFITCELSEIDKAEITQKEAKKSIGDLDSNYQDKQLPFQADEVKKVYLIHGLPRISLSKEGNTSLSTSKKASILPIGATETDGLRAIIIKNPTSEQLQQNVRWYPDRRRKVQNDFNRLYWRWPNSMHGHLITKFENKICTGTGTLIGPNHVLTAGHNLYDQEGGGWPKEVIFSPARSGRNFPFGEVMGCILLSNKEWIPEPSKPNEKKITPNANYDFGMVILEEPVGYFTGYSGLLCVPDEDLNGHKVSITGYPDDKGGPALRATEMWTMAGFINSVESERLFYDIDTCTGQSGSGVCGEWESYGEGYFTVGIHIRAGKQLGKGNDGVRISLTKFKRILKWMSEYYLPSENDLYSSWRRRAEAKDPDAQYKLGRLYYCGDGHTIEPDYEKALNYFKQAEKNGYFYGSYALGSCYEEGRGKNKNGKYEYCDEYDECIETDNKDKAAFNEYMEAYRRYEKYKNQHPEVLSCDPQISCALGRMCLKETLTTITADSKGAFQYLDEAARIGDREGQYYLGYYYEIGKGIPTDIYTAVSYYSQALHQDFMPAYNRLGLLFATEKLPSDKYFIHNTASHFFNIPAVHDEYSVVDLVINLFRIPAIKDYAPAQNNLGWIYSRKSGIFTAVKNFTMSKKWIEKAANQGLAVAQYNMGVLLSPGSGAQLYNIFDWYEKAALQGYLQAQHNLGCMFIEGLGIDTVIWGSKETPLNEAKAHEIYKNKFLGKKNWGYENQNEALRWLNMASDSGYAPSQHLLGCLYLEGAVKGGGLILSIKQDDNQAAKYFCKGSDNNYAPSQNNLAVMYVQNRGVSSQILDPIELLKKAALSLQEAQFNLGLINHQGMYNLQINEEEAEKLYSQACNLGKDIWDEIKAYPLAKNNLGYLLFHKGKFEAAKNYYESAAYKGCTVAKYNLGLLFLDTQKIIPSYERAIEWWSKKDVIKEIPSACNNLGVLYIRAYYGISNIQEALNYIKKAAEEGLATAQFNLGLMYWRGDGVDKSCEEARQWFERALQKEFYPAKRNLYCVERGMKFDEEPFYDRPDLVTHERQYYNIGKQGVLAEQHDLGILYLLIGKIKEIAEPISLIQNAAEKELIEAQYNLGVLYMLGKGIPKNDIAANELLIKAANKGFQSAKDALRTLHEDVTLMQSLQLSMCKGHMLVSTLQYKIEKKPIKTLYLAE